jgi:hypothetical protein
MASKVCSHDPSTPRAEHRPKRKRGEEEGSDSVTAPTRATRSSTRQTKSTTATTTKKTTKKKVAEDPVDGDVCIGPLDFLSPTPNPGLPSLSPRARLSLHSPRNREQRKSTEATKRTTAKSTKSKQCVCRAQYSRFASIVTAPPGPIRNDVSDNVGKDLNGYVHLHGLPLPHCIRSEDTPFRPFRCWQAR